MLEWQSVYEIWFFESIGIPFSNGKSKILTTKVRCEHCSQNFLEKEKALKDEIYEVVGYLFSTVRVNMAYNDNLRVVWFSSLYICAPCDEANAKSWKWIQILNVFIEKLYPCPSVIKIKVEIRSFSVTCTYRSFDLIKGGNESKQRKSLEKYRGKDEERNIFRKRKRIKRRRERNKEKKGRKEWK